MPLAVGTAAPGGSGRFSFALAIAVIAISAASGQTDDPSIAEARRLVESGSLGDAERLLREIVNQSPGNAPACNLLGVVHARSGDRPAAEAAFREAVRIAPRFAPAYLNLGRLYQEASSERPSALPKAVAAYRNAVALDPGSVEARYQLAYLLQAQGGYEESQSFYESLPAADRDRAQALAIACGNLVALGRHAEAARSAGRLLAAPDLAEQDVNAVLPVLARGEEGGRIGIRLLEGLRERGVASAGSLVALARLYERRESYGAALEALENAAAMRPEGHSELLVAMASVASKQADFRKALGYLAHARDLRPKDPEIHFLFGMACVQLDLLAEAKDALEKAVELEPERPRFRFALAAVLSVQREADEAIPHFRKYLAARPGDIEGLVGLGYVLFRAARFDEAREHLAQAAQAADPPASAHYFLGRIALEVRDFEEAALRFAEAVRLDPAHADAHADLGLARLRMQQADLAKQAIEKAVELAPEGFRPNLHLLLLYQRTRDPRASSQQEKLARLRERGDKLLDSLRRRIEIRPHGGSGP